MGLMFFLFKTADLVVNMYNDRFTVHGSGFTVKNFRHYKHVRHFLLLMDL